jgi:serine phosphatase RsbU (regulator of sigma subunit)
MEIHYSLEDVARTSDDTAVRRRFDQRNFLWLVLLLVFSGFAAFILLVDDRGHTPAHVLTATADLALVAATLFLLRDVHRFSRNGGVARWPVTAWMFKHLSATALAWSAAQYLFLIALTSSEGWVGWVIAYPMMMIGYRMLVSELALLHVFLVGTAIVSVFILPSDQGGLPFAIASAAINAMFLAAEVFLSTRLARQVRKEWGERRNQAREQVRMRDELLYARELQLTMLPECDPKLPWVDICSTSLPATEVGGDYYDYFPEGNTLALVSADVAGHGLASGLVLASIRAGFTLMRHDLHDPAAVLSRLHDLVAQTSRRRMLVTASVVLLERNTGEAIIASAGHPPVLIRRSDGSVESVDLFGPPLGVRLPVKIAQRRVRLGPGDLFVMHSDGIYEARNMAEDTFGLERLSELISEHGNDSAEALRNAIVGEIALFRGAREQDDDATVVVCRIV